MGDQFLDAGPIGSGQQLVDLAAGVAEADQRLAGQRSADRRRGVIEIASSPSAEPTFSRSSTTIRSAVRLPIPGTACSRAVSPAETARQQRPRRRPRQHGQRHLGPDRLDPEQHQEQVALLLGGEAVQRQRVVADHQVGVQRDRADRPPGSASASRPRPRAGTRRHRYRSPHGRRGGPRPSPRSERSSATSPGARGARRAPQPPHRACAGGRPAGGHGGQWRRPAARG